MVRRLPTADDSFAEMRARSRFGIAMAAMIRMIATTISNSISEKPFCFFIMYISPSQLLSCPRLVSVQCAYHAKNDASPKGAILKSLFLCDLANVPVYVRNSTELAGRHASFMT